MTVDIKEITKKLNTARLEAGDYKFEGRKEFQEYLKCYGIKVGNYVLCSKLYTAMCKDGRFISEPIYIEKVKAIYDSVNEYARIHNKIHNKKKDTMKDKEVIPVENQEESQKYDLVQAAIDLLKSEGYRILKPVTEYKEV